MPFQDTVLGGLLKAVPRGQLARLVAEHGSDKGVRRLTSWGQLVALLVAQLAGCGSLREIEALFGSQGGALYHLGTERVRRSTLSAANAKRPAAMFESLFAILLRRLGERVPAAVAREVVRLVDATSIQLAHAAHGWARRSAEHAGVKLHLVFDPVTTVPTYFTVTPCKINDIVEAKKLPLERGAIYVFDKGYYNFAFWAGLEEAGCRFVTRLKRNSPTRLIEERPVAGEAILADRLIRLSERLAGQRRNPCQGLLREVLVARPGKEPLRLVSNDLESPAERIAELYRRRWQVELLFKWLKQNLKLRRFLGRSENAVAVQLITALIAYLLLHYAHRAALGSLTRQRFRQLLQASLWQRRPLAQLAHPPPRPAPPRPTAQLALALALP